MKIPYRYITVGDEQLKVPDFQRMFGGSWWPLLGIVVIIWLASGIYKVDADEQGVIQTFGKFTSITTSGLNYHLPYPIQKVTKPKVTEIKRIEIGFRSGRNVNNVKSANRDMEQESLMLTGGLNMVDIDMIVQYKIADPVKYLFRVRDVKETVRMATEAVIRQVVGKHPIDEVLTTGKGNIQANTKLQLQEILNNYECGVQVIQVQLQDVLPPREVEDAFREVASAKEDRARLINEAQGYRNNLIPKTRGEAEQMKLQAQAFAAERVTKAEGDASNFLAMMKEYQRAPSVTRKRMLLETMEDVLPGLKKYILKTQAGGDLINIVGPGLSGGEGKATREGGAK